MRPTCPICYYRVTRRWAWTTVSHSIPLVMFCYGPGLSLALPHSGCHESGYHLLCHALLYSSAICCHGFAIYLLHLETIMQTTHCPKLQNHLVYHMVWPIRRYTLSCSKEFIRFAIFIIVNQKLKRFMHCT